MTKILEKKCFVCGRPLRSQNSWILGVGPVCVKKLRGFKARKKLERDGQVPLFKWENEMKKQFKKGEHGSGKKTLSTL